MSTGGSIESITLAGRTFSIAADADVTRKLGGFENESQANGDGTTRTIKTRVPWMLGGLVANVNDARGDHEFLQDISDANDLVPVTISMASGVIYQGTGIINGELGASSQSTTATFDIMGAGKLTKQ